MTTKKTYAVLNNILHGTGLKHRLYRPGETIELDPMDPEQKETIAELLAKDFIEDPENPRERTPEEKMRLELRQIAGGAVQAPSASASRTEQAAGARLTKIEEGLIAPTDADERAARARVQRAEAEK